MRPELRFPGSSFVEPWQRVSVGGVRRSVRSRARRHAGSGGNRPCRAPVVSQGQPVDSVVQTVQVSIRPVASGPSTESRWDPPALLPEKIAPIARPAKLLPMPSVDPMPVVAFDETAYTPANQLTVRPAAAQYIAVPYPKHARAEGVLKTVLAIFIDEDGTVARVRVHDSRLPEPFARSAIETFSRATFHPGRAGVTPVKSRMLVEVEFDAGQPDERVVPLLASVAGKR